MRKIANNDLLKQVFKKYHAKFGTEGYKGAKLGLAALISNPDRSDRYSKAPQAQTDRYIELIQDKYDDIVTASSAQRRQIKNSFNAVIPLPNSFWTNTINLRNYNRGMEQQFIHFIRDLHVPETSIDTYISKIINDYDDIILADQTKMTQLITDFDAIIPFRQINQELWSDIVEKMNYKALRSNDFIELVQELGIKTCIYCHAQLTVIIDKELYEEDEPSIPAKKGDVKSRRGLLELDHRHAKSKHPFLCTSFYNLYPTCANCNRIKSSKATTFDLYCDLEDLEVFEFSLDKCSMIMSLAESKSELLDIKITSRNISDEDAKDFIELFDIKEIYDTQKDIVEELVHKKIVYTDKYQKELLDKFSELFPDETMLNRLIIGNYDQPQDMYKRPLSKFMQDIARDIGLIPKLPSKTT